MIGIVRLRRRLPFLVFILLLVLFVVALGFICVCASDHPANAAERAASAAAHAPAVLVLWGFLMFVAAPLLLQPSAAPLRTRDRASPAALQRFLL
ncbi:MAG: hypothetical protein ACJ757_11355 [Gaiellaceae bacterium]